MTYYKLYEMSHAALAPWRALADMTRLLYINPLNPASHTRMGKQIAAAAELFERTTRRYGKPEFGIDKTRVNGVPVPVNQKIVWSRPFCDLLHFERVLPARAKPSPRLLIVAPMSGHYATLLRGTVQTMSEYADVYITDWADARMVPLADGVFDLDDYIDYVISMLHFLGPNTHVMAVCQPSVPVLAAVAVMNARMDPAAPATMTLMGGPIDTRHSPTVVNQYAADRPFAWFEDNLIYRVPGKYPGAGRRVYPGFLQHAGFIAMNPDRHATSHWDFYQSLIRGDLEDAEQHRRFYDEYNAVLDMPAEYYLDTIHTVFQEHRLPQGIWDVRTAGATMRVDPGMIRDVALLTIEGELDDISGPGQTEAAHRLTPGIPETSKRHHLAPGAGHYGIFSGRRWREQIYPRVRDFIAQHRERIAA